MAFHIVTRPFEGERPYHVGEVVDADGWRYARQLVERRFLRPATEGEVAAATAPAEMSGVPTSRRARRLDQEEAPDAK